MNLTELIKVLTDPARLAEFYQEQGVDTASEALIISMRETLSLKSEVSIFAIEETEGNLFFEKNGVHYVELFSVDHTRDLLEEGLDLKNRGYSDEAKAQRLLEYRINDA